jgi:hypothetical protein
MDPTTTAKPTATATIEPMGPRTKVPRDHSIKVVVKLSARDAKYADKGYAAGVARMALRGFPPVQGAADRRGFGDLSEPATRTRSGAPSSVVVAVEGSVVWSGRPEDDSIEGLRAALLGEGYRVDLRERRECSEPECSTFAMVAWNRPSDVPSHWYSSTVCGKHDYRACAKCKSVYVMTSTNAAGQAPSLHCEVCGDIMVGWGRSKIWSAELVTRDTRGMGSES